MTQHVLAFGLPGGVEWMVALVIALLIFGRRLPDVARSVGKSIVEFKRGIKDIESDVEAQSRLESPGSSSKKSEEGGSKENAPSPASDSGH